MVPPMRRLALLFLSLACALTLSTSVVACGSDDETVDGGTGGPADAGAGEADAAGGDPADAAGGGGDDAGVLPR
jgi:hypothetical protein